MNRNAFWACCCIVLAPGLLEAQDRVNWTVGGGLVTASLGSFAPEGYYANGGARVRVGGSFAVRADVPLATHEARTSRQHFDSSSPPFVACRSRAHEAGPRNSTAAAPRCIRRPGCSGAFPAHTASRSARTSTSSATREL